jgi:hypothetical protein
MKLTATSSKLFALFLMSANAGAALADRDFKCGARNNTCVIYDRGAVTGDKVGFFTERGELIATGQVTRMQGNARAVQLQQVMGPVSTQAESYAMLEGPTSVTQEQYRLYKQPTPIAIAGQIGLATLGAGGDAKGYEASAEMIRRKFLGKVDGFVRGSIYSFSGTATNIYEEAGQAKFGSTSVAALGGLGYTLFSQNDFLIRTEAGVGLSYTVAKINNSISDAKSKDWGYEVNSGFGLHARAMLVGGYRFDGWQLEGGFAPGLLAGKSTTAIGAGLLINLK